MRVAELLRIDPAGCRAADRRQHAGHAAHRSTLRGLRLAPRACVPGRIRHAHRRPLLHELAGAELFSRSSPGVSALEAALARQSWSKVTEEAPSRQELLALIAAAGRVADHSALQPWRLIELRG